MPNIAGFKVNKMFKEELLRDLKREGITYNKLINALLLYIEQLDREGGELDMLSQNEYSNVLGKRYSEIDMLSVSAVPSAQHTVLKDFATKYKTTQTNILRTLLYRYLINGLNLDYWIRSTPKAKRIRVELENLVFDCGHFMPEDVRQKFFEKLKLL